VKVAAVVEPERLIFVDECVLGIPLIGTDLRLRAKRKASASEGAQRPRQEHHAAF
jgi:hypothetical protein